MAGVVFFGGWLLKCSYSIPLSSEPHCGSRLFSENSMLTTDNCFLTRRWPFGGFKKTFFLYFFQGKQNVILSSFSSSSVYINSTVHIGNEAPENHFETIEYAENWFCYHAKLSMYRLCVCVCLLHYTQYQSLHLSSPNRLYCSQEKECHTLSSWDWFFRYRRLQAPFRYVNCNSFAYS